MPSPTTADQWNLVHGRRSIRAGTKLLSDLVVVAELPCWDMVFSLHGALVIGG